MLAWRRQSVDGARNVFGVVINVKGLVDSSRDGLNFSTKIALDIVQVETIVPVDQVNSKTQVTIASRSTNTMQIGLSILREIKVDDNVDGLDINTTCQEIRTDQVPTDTVSEVVEYSVSGVLGHLSVTVKTRITKLGDLLSEQLDTVGGITENDGLVDLELGEESVQAVNLLLLLNKSIVLCDTTESKLVHEVNFVRVDHVLVRKVFDRQRESSGEQHYLTILGMESQKLLDDRCELLRKELVSFVHDEHGALAEVGDVLSCQIQNTSGSAHNYVDGILQTNDIISQTSTTSCDHDVDSKVLAKSLTDLRSLHSKFSSRYEYETLNLSDFGVDAF